MKSGFKIMCRQSALGREELVSIADKPQSLRGVTQNPDHPFQCPKLAAQMYWKSQKQARKRHPHVYQAAEAYRAGLQLRRSHVHSP